MFHKMINNARDRWYNSQDCTIGGVIGYIEKKGQMRDAQVEAIKTYLYLKIGCGNKPLHELFARGTFNSLNIRELDNVEMTVTSRAMVERNPATAALMEYSRLKNSDGEQVAKSLEDQIRKYPETIDYEKVLRDAFYGVSYTDYLFSLPMGAGKTYLMAAFIYLDLYFAVNEPENSAFAHNFIIFAPSGLKSSVVPSLRTIQRFDPSWILPEPAATDIKRKIRFEVLDQAKTANKSNRVKNPNVQKIAAHQPFSELIGLVAVTNAEKVILDRIQEQDGQITFTEESDDDRDRAANELRNLIGKIPNLSVFIDEVHHAVKDEIKLRAVVNKWAGNNTVNSVIGFSGTPYIDKADKIKVNETLSVVSSEISNIVYYYPLVSGIGNFLKRPVVEISDLSDSAGIVENGIREFLDKYKDTAYNGGLVSKLGIYCGTIEKLERMVYPLALQIAQEYGLPPDSILKFHKGNKEYPQPLDSQYQFDMLDSPMSQVRIILLVQIGKEGWDCRSLTGIILSQEGDCPKNMVLQTSCRCLRQVEKKMPETALIYLNGSNGEKLTHQLRQQHHISLGEFVKGDSSPIIKRYDRRKYLKLPPVEFYQLKIHYDTLVTEAANPNENIPHAAQDAEFMPSTVTTQDFSLIVSETRVDYEERGNIPAAFFPWLYDISKSSFGFVTMGQLKEHETALQGVFDTITYVRNGARYFSSRFDRELVKSRIRKAFCDRRTFKTITEMIPESAVLLNIENFTAEVTTDTPDDFYPDQTITENIMLDDEGKLEIEEKELNFIRAAQEAGYHDIAEAALQRHASHPAKNRSFHYLPYKTDSGFEETFLKEVTTYDVVKELGLEVYYNGDRTLTDFKIRCYKGAEGKWRYIGRYTPDFLIISRRNGRIHKVAIVETKGRVYANDPAFKDKRKFMETHFRTHNNEVFGYDRFDYLCLEDSLPPNERIAKTYRAISKFFREGTENAS